jgi:hypothetical protein
VNEQNDPHHCGGCGIACTGVHPYCGAGHCGTPPCNGIFCPAFDFCCGTKCCTAAQLCCDVHVGGILTPTCTAPVNNTCPLN